MNKNTEDRIIEAYIEAIYFTDTGDDEQPGGDAELADETLDRIEQDVKTFVGLAAESPEALAAIEESPLQTGQDFWLTRNGHGAGFWDGDWPEVIGEFLTDCCEKMGELSTYEGDDRLMYFV